MIIRIKCELAKHGYDSMDFYNIQHKYDWFDSDDYCPSRDILFAIVWYLSKRNLIDRFAKNANTIFDFEISNQLVDEVN
jgi:hypothetical protein